MKNLILLVAILFLFIGCKAEDDQSTDNPPPTAPPVSDPTSDTPPPIADPTSDTRPTPPPADPSSDIGPPRTPTPFRPDPTDDTPEPEPGVILPVKLALLTDRLYFYDGIEFKDQSSDSPKSCGYRCFTDGIISKYYDEFGDVSSSHNLIVKPDFIYGDYIIENIDPETAYSLGARYRNYTKIWIDGVEQQWWFFNQYMTAGLISIGDDIFTKDNFGKFRDINENLIDINAANGLVVYDFDPSLRLAKIRADGIDKGVSWLTNYFNNAEQWQFADGRWFSNNGYEFYNGSLVERANALWAFNTGQIIIDAGTRPENSETVLYWIDAGSGWLWRYLRGVNRLETVWRLYDGDGTRSTGIAKRDILKPVLIGSELYFNNDGSVWKIDIDSGLIGVFYGGNGEIIRYD